MQKKTPLDLGRRERQIMEAVYAREQASVSQVQDALADPPSYSAVRAILNNLVDKGELKRKKSGKKFLYLPTVPRARARRSVLRNMLTTFFNGSTAQAMSAMIDLNGDKLSEEELDELSRMIDEARTGRGQS